MAVSTNAQRVSEFGIDPVNMFEFWDWFELLVPPTPEQLERIGGPERHDGALRAGLVVRAMDELQQGASVERVLQWLATAAPVPGFIGFAVGRTLWRDALERYVAGEQSRDEATRRIADRYMQMIDAYRADAQPAGAEA